MTGAELIDQAIQFYDNTLAADLENANRRLRVLHYVRMVADEVWNWRPWPFKHATGSVTTASGVGALPVDFSRLGPEGVVWEPSARKAWTEALPGDIITLQLRGDVLARIFAVTSVGSRVIDSGAEAGVVLGDTVVSFGVGTTLPADLTAGDWINFLAVPETLTVSTRNGDQELSASTAATLDHSVAEAYTIVRAGGPALIVPDPAARTLSVYYEKVCPAVEDTPATLQNLPLSYHRTVLLAGVLARMQTAKNDMRMYWEKQYAMGLARMVANELPLAGRMKQMPMSVGVNNC